MIRNNFFKRGYSIPELLVVVGILTMLFFLGSDTLFSPQRTNIINTSTDSLIAEISYQQNKSMSGDIGTGAVQNSYGIYFASSYYTTFRGTNYSAGNSTNFTTNLHPNLKFSSINLPSSQVIFATSSGAIQGYSGAQNTLTIQDLNANISKTLRFNQHGVVESVQ